MGDTKTLRDEFAMAALIGWAAGRNNGGSYASQRMDGDPDNVAQGCYKYADAMLAERNKPIEPQNDAAGFFNTDDENPNEAKP